MHFSQREIARGNREKNSHSEVTRSQNFANKWRIMQTYTTLKSSLSVTFEEIHRRQKARNIITEKNSLPAAPTWCFLWIFRRNDARHVSAVNSREKN
eukprot:765275-Hanusia_phi.AAC.2